MALILNLARGPTAPVGVLGWQAGSFNSTAANTNLVVTGNVFEIFDVGLYLDVDNVGVPPRWELPAYDQELVTCKRYYYINRPTTFGDVIAVMQAYTSADVLGLINYHPVAMRATPTVALSSSAHVQHMSANASVTSNFSAANIYANAYAIMGGFTGASNLVPGNASFIRWNTTSGYISADARL